MSGDYQDQPYPSPELCQSILRAYLSFCELPADDASVAALLRGVEAMSLLSYLFWCVWGLFQICNSNVEFDYGTYCASRIKRYFQRRDAALGIQ
jgi:hypothetical protein